MAPSHGRKGIPGVTPDADTARNLPFRRRASGTSRLERLAACLRGDVAPDTDWLEVIATANQHLVGPQLYRNLCASEAGRTVDPEVLEYLSDMDAANRERNRRLYGQLAEITTAMSAAGLAPIALKGAAVLARSGGAPETTARMLSDLDILVGEEDGAKADHILRGIGYDLFGGSAFGHSSGSYFRADVVGAVDVHVRLPGRFRKVVSAQDLRDRTRSVVLGDGSIRVPDASLHFVVNIAHDMMHHQGILKGFTDMRYLLELVHLCEDPDNPLDWPWIEAKCADRRFSLALELQSMMARYVGAPAFSGVKTTALGRMLHGRRLLKARYERLGLLEWEAIRRAKRLRRPRAPGSNVST